MLQLWLKVSPRPHIELFVFLFPLLRSCDGKCMFILPNLMFSHRQMEFFELIHRLGREKKGKWYRLRVLGQWLTWKYEIWIFDAFLDKQNNWENLPYSLYLIIIIE